MPLSLSVFRLMLWWKKTEWDLWRPYYTVYAADGKLTDFKQVLLNHCQAWGIFMALMTTAAFSGFLLVPAYLSSSSSNREHRLLEQKVYIGLMTLTAAYGFVSFLGQTKLYLFYNSVHPDYIKIALETTSSIYLPGYGKLSELSAFLLLASYICGVQLTYTEEVMWYMIVGLIVILVLFIHINRSFRRWNDQLIGGMSHAQFEPTELSRQALEAILQRQREDLESGLATLLARERVHLQQLLISKPKCGP